MMTMTELLISVIFIGHKIDLKNIEAVNISTRLSVCLGSNHKSEIKLA